MFPYEHPPKANAAHAGRENQGLPNAIIKAFSSLWSSKAPAAQISTHDERNAAQKACQDEQLHRWEPCSALPCEPTRGTRLHPDSHEHQQAGGEAGSHHYPPTFPSLGENRFVLLGTTATPTGHEVLVQDEELTGLDSTSCVCTETSPF